MFSITVVAVETGINPTIRFISLCDNVKISFEYDYKVNQNSPSNSKLRDNLTRKAGWSYADMSMKKRCESGGRIMIWIKSKAVCHSSFSFVLLEMSLRRNKRPPRGSYEIPSDAKNE